MGTLETSELFTEASEVSTVISGQRTKSEMNPNVFECRCVSDRGHGRRSSEVWEMGKIHEGNGHRTASQKLGDDGICG